MQRLLLLPEMHEVLRIDEWQQCFERVLFPLMMSLALPPRPGVDPAMIDETRLRVCNMLTKVARHDAPIWRDCPQIFLLHLNVLSTSANFVSLWTRILDCLDTYSRLGELLAEAIPESLKNMLLVMSTSAVFKHQDSRDPLWELTWLRIRQFLPSLHAAMYPEQRPAPAVVQAPAPSEFVLGPPLAFASPPPSAPAAQPKPPSEESVALHPHPIIV